MKNLLPVLLFLLSSSSLFSQDSVMKSDNRHEIGVDAGPLLERFLFNPNPSTSSPYFLTYRYHFPNWALRARAGGSFSHTDYVNNDTVFNRNGSHYLELRMGAERKVNFARRWQFLYGIDLYTGISKSWSEIENSPADVDYYENSQNRFGAAPFLGFRFKINERISLITESYFLVYYATGRDIRTYSEAPEYNRIADINEINTGFAPPFFLFFNYNF